MLTLKLKLYREATDSHMETEVMVDIFDPGNDRACHEMMDIVEANMPGWKIKSWSFSCSF